MAVKFARRLENAEGSAIREILKLASNPEVISFAGGLPAPELFPVEEMKKVALAVLEEQGSSNAVLCNRWLPTTKRSYS